MANAPIIAQPLRPPPWRWRTHAFVAAIVLLAFVLRVAWVAYSGFAPNPRDDTGAYDALGRALAAASGYDNIDGSAQLFWPPGYPMLLAGIYKATGDSLRAALLLNAALGALSVAFVYAIGRRAFDAHTALLGALIAALFPSLIFFAGVTMTEVSFTFFLLLALWLIIESAASGAWWFLVPAGLVIGFASLIRGHAFLLPLVAVPFWWRSIGAWQPALLRAAGVMLLAALVIAPWTARNHARADAFVPIAANFGIDLYIGNSPHADGRLIFTQDFTYPPGLPAQEVQARLNRDAGREAVKYAATHPLREVELAVRKVYGLYYSDHEALAWNDGHGARFLRPESVSLVLALLSDGWYWLALLAAIAGIRVWCSTQQPVHLLLLSVVVYWTLVHVVFFGDPRFHAPILPIIALWAAAGVMRYLPPRSMVVADEDLPAGGAA